jgi:hypothetical protein
MPHVSLNCELSSDKQALDFKGVLKYYLEINILTY